MLQTHGGNLDEARNRYGGCKEYWLDLSTGINPVPYPVDVPMDCHIRLPQAHEVTTLEKVAQKAYNAQHPACVAAPGTSALIQNLSRVFVGQPVAIVTPTYSEHAAAFAGPYMRQIGHPREALAEEGLIVVHPNNPDGRTWTHDDLGTHPFIIIDESFCDLMPERSLVGHDDLIILKSFGKFFGLAGLRLGFCLCAQDVAKTLRQMMGPWPVSGAAIHTATQALADTSWIAATRTRLAKDMQQMLTAMPEKLSYVGGTNLFALFEVQDAFSLQDHLAHQRIWTRIFDYNPRWIRIGLSHDMDRLGEAIACF